VQRRGDDHPERQQRVFGRGIVERRLLGLRFRVGLVFRIELRIGVGQLVRPGLVHGLGVGLGRFVGHWPERIEHVRHHAALQHPDERVLDHAVTLALRSRRPNI
jgi:hypothetical protein